MPMRIASRVAAPVAAATAHTGLASDEWLRRGVLPIGVHYYQPVFDPATLPAELWELPHELPGIDLRLDAQRMFLQELSAYADEPQWPEYQTGRGYHWRNDSFSYPSAILLYAVLRHLKPRRVIEIGAGMSTLVSADALGRNGAGSLTTIEPYPDRAPQFGHGNAELIDTPVQDVSLDLFMALADDDVLFIDSSHVVRTGGDVNYLYLTVLPRLRPGVVVHIHDIQLPYEYHRQYSTRTDSPRVFWTEQYLLQALLQDNPRWEILLAGYMWQRDHAEFFASLFPGWRRTTHRASTSFYMRRL
jgi:predicted O-methyltransferase YrrM